MGNFYIISLSIFFLATASVFYLYKFKSKSNVSKTHKREADARKLNSHEKKIFKMAKELYNQGKIESAAQFLESIDMKREAIEMLERHGFVHEAAGILLRMHLPQRAGAVYGRNQKWKEAYRCFLQAQMPKEAAICAWNSGEIGAAADLFLRADMKKEAADAYAESGSLQSAAKLYRDLGNTTRALELYHEIGSKTQDLSVIILDMTELNFLEESISSGYSDPTICDLLGQNERLAPAVLNLINLEKMKAAADAYSRSTKDIGPELMSRVDYTSTSALRLAELFEQLSNFTYSGMVFQRIGKFELAGNSFAKAEEFERAIECYEKAGKQDLATEMKIQAATVGKKNTRPMGNPITQSRASIPAAEPKEVPSEIGEQIENNLIPEANREEIHQNESENFSKEEKTGIFNLNDIASIKSEQKENSSDLPMTQQPVTLDLSLDLHEAKTKEEEQELEIKLPLVS